jgi:hypothetical protein
MILGHAYDGRTSRDWESEVRNLVWNANRIRNANYSFSRCDGSNIDKLDL